jgi:leucyl-tRNA synthetase
LNFSSAPLSKLLHKTIKKVGEDIESMRFNTAVSSMMILATEMEKMEFLDKNDLKKFLQILSPFAPHIADELWHVLGEKKSINISSWPIYDEKEIVDNELKIIIQVNGKVRAEMFVRADEDEEKIKEQAQNISVVKKFTEGVQIKKIIYVKNRLVNIVI